MDKATADFSAAIRLDDKDIMAYLSRSDALMQEGQFQSALSDLNTVIEIDTGDARAYGTRGLVLLAVGEDVQADQNFKQCFTLDSSLELEFKQSANEVRKAFESSRKAALERESAIQIEKLSV